SGGSMNGVQNYDSSRVLRLLQPYRALPATQHVHHNRAERIEDVRSRALALLRGTGAPDTMDLLNRMAARRALPEAPSGVPRAASDVAWLGELYACVERRHLQNAIDILFRNVNALLVEGRYAECDQVLRAIDVNRLESNLLIGVL